MICFCIQVQVLAQVADFISMYFQDVAVNGLIPAAKLVKAVTHLHDQGHFFFY